MTVKIDLSVLPQNIKVMIIKEIEKIFHSENSDNDNHDSSQNIQYIDNDIIDIKIDKKTHLKSIKQKLKDILIKNRIKEYVVISNPEEKENIIVLHRKNSEKLGIYHCHYCGMAFDNEIQLTTHHRMHYVT
jgi:hypothetical protein